MKNYYSNTTRCINRYNNIIDKISSSSKETTDEEDEFLQNFVIYFAHALIKDHGFGQTSRKQLIQVADIIKAFGI